MQLVHWRKPLALAAPVRVSALARIMLSRSQSDQVLFLLTKHIREAKTSYIQWISGILACRTRKMYITPLSERDLCDYMSAFGIRSSLSHCS